MLFFLGEKKLSTLCLGFVLGLSCVTAASKDVDVVIYGDTSAAIASAVQVKRMGKTVVSLPRMYIYSKSVKSLGVWVCQHNWFQQIKA